MNQAERFEGPARAVRSQDPWYFFNRQLLSAPPRVVKTARTDGLSNVMSRSAESATTGALGVRSATVQARSALRAAQPRQGVVAPGATGAACGGAPVAGVLVGVGG